MNLLSKKHLYSFCLFNYKITYQQFAFISKEIKRYKT
jgi:hypothetical protein